jgi:queuine tRNA-ribosyltransferase
MPDDKPKYAMGIGKPKDIIQGVKLGYNMFDCVIPTRDARHKRLFILQNGKIKSINIRKKHLKKGIKLFNCSFNELYNLFKLKDNRARRLATMHNLRFYSRLVERLRHHKV